MWSRVVVVVERVCVCVCVCVCMIKESQGGKEQSTHRRKMKQWVFHSTLLCVCAQPCLTLCNPMDCSLPVSLSMEFSHQEYWSGLLCPSPGDLPNPGIEPTSPALAGGFFATCIPPGKPPTFLITLLSWEMKELAWKLALTLVCSLPPTSSGPAPLPKLSHMWNVLASWLNTCRPISVQVGVFESFQPLISN